MEFENKTGYHPVPSEEHNMKESPIYNDKDGEKEDENKKKKKEERGKKKLRHRKIFWVCFSNVQIGSKVLFQDENKKKREEVEDEDGFKVKEEGFLFSNVEIEPKEDMEKVKELVEKINKKSCFLVCYSNIQVAP